MKHLFNFCASILLIFSLIQISNNALCSFSPSKRDSILKIWNDPQQSDSLRMDAIRHFAWHGYLFSQPDSAFYFAQWHFDFAKDKGDSLQMSIALNVQATALNFKGDFEKAIALYNQSLAINEARKDERGIGVILNNIGNIYRKQGDYPMATDYFFRSLKIREEAEDIRGIATSLGSIGTLYMDQKQYDEAISYFTQCLSYLEQLGDKIVIAGTINNLGLIYADQGDLNKALDAHNQSLSIRQELNNPRGIAESFMNIGNVQRELGEFDSAIDNYEQSLAISVASKDRNGEAQSKYNIGLTYLKQKNYNKALEYGNQSLRIATEIGNITIKKDAYFLLYESNKALNRHGIALEQFEMHILLRDSIYKEEYKEELIRQQFQYEYEKQKALLIAEQIQKDAIAEKKLLAKQQKQNLMIILFGVIILVLIGASWFVIRDRKVKYKIIVAQSELKALRSQLKPHFVFNVLNSIHAFILNEDSQSASKYLVSFSKVMRSALESMNRDLNNLEEEMDLLHQLIDLESMRLKKEIKLIVNADEDWSDYMVPAMILQPIIENAILHGAQNAPNDSDEIIVQIETKKDVLAIHVKNHHHGQLNVNTEKEQDQAKRFGFSITQERIKLINKKHKIKGDLSIQFDEASTTVKLVLPLINT